MIVKELKEKIASLPDDMIIGGSGYFGELLACDFIEVRDVHKDIWDREEVKILCISIEYPGDEPD